MLMECFLLDSSKLEKWLEEVANELQNENNDTVLK